MAPDSLPEPIAVAGLVAQHLGRIGAVYVIGGSFASSVHGEPRSTNDIDMVVDLRAVDVDAFIDAMSTEFYVSRDAVVDAVRAGGTFNLIHMPTALKVDMFVAGFDAFDQARLQRRTPVAFSTVRRRRLGGACLGSRRSLAGGTSIPDWCDGPGPVSSRDLRLERSNAHWRSSIIEYRQGMSPAAPQTAHDR